MQRLRDCLEQKEHAARNPTFLPYASSKVQAHRNRTTCRHCKHTSCTDFYYGILSAPQLPLGQHCHSQLVSDRSTYHSQLRLGVIPSSWQLHGSRHLTQVAWELVNGPNLCQKLLATCTMAPVSLHRQVSCISYPSGIAHPFTL